MRMRLGRRNGKVAKLPFKEQTEAEELAGFATLPPIAGPTIVPIEQTNDITHMLCLCV